MLFQEAFVSAFLLFFVFQWSACFSSLRVSSFDVYVSPFFSSSLVPAAAKKLSYCSFSLLPLL